MPFTLVSSVMSVSSSMTALQNVVVEQPAEHDIRSCIILQALEFCKVKDVLVKDRAAHASMTLQIHFEITCYCLV